MGSYDIVKAGPSILSLQMGWLLWVPTNPGWAGVRSSIGADELPGHPEIKGGRVQEDSLCRGHPDTGSSTPVGPTAIRFPASTPDPGPDGSLVRVQGPEGQPVPGGTSTQDPSHLLAPRPSG